MRQFNYLELKESSWDAEIVSLVANIREHKGRHELYRRQKQVELERLAEIAMIQSIDSSNKIEGIRTSNARMKQLVDGNITPHTRDEQEIAGYRDLQKIIFESYEHIPVKADVILQLHRDLFVYTDRTFGGTFKNTQNYISEVHADGSSFIRFTPLQPFETPMAVDALCTTYQEAIEGQVIDPLLLIPIFISDFLCIHPFADGNGRISRLLTTLLLHKSGFMIGRYISIEKMIEETKGAYYDVLAKTSKGWHQGENDYAPFIQYLLGIVLRSGRQLENRLGSIDHKKSSYEIVRVAVGEVLGVFTKAQILERCPSIGSSSVEAALKRLTEEGYILRQGAGRNTAYVRNPKSY
jgi:Fic family protein